MFGEILKVAGWLLFVVFKFIWAPLTMINATDYLWWEVLLITIAGAWIGMVVFFYFGKAIMQFFLKRRKNPPKKFTKLNRFVVKVKSKYGLTGLVAIIGIISVPVCSLIAAAYFKENKRAVPAIMLSTTIWAVWLTGIVFFFKDYEAVLQWFRWG